MGVEPLTRCKVKLLECHELYSGMWFEDFQGQHPYFRWSGKAATDDGCDINRSQCAEIALGTYSLGGAYIPGARPSIEAALQVTPQDGRTDLPCT